MLKIIIAAGPVIVEDNKVLLNKHGDDKFWKFCGGRVNDDELNLWEAAKREVMEEMGLEVKLLESSPYIFYTEKNGVSVVLVHFLAQRLNEIVIGADISEWRWIALDDLATEDLAPNILPTLSHFKFYAN